MLVSVLAACGDAPTAPADSPLRVEEAWVVGDAAAAVDPSSGLFRLPDPGARYLTRDVAETIAVAVARFLGDPALLGNAVAFLQQDRGGVIDFDHLAPCARATYSMTPVGELPPQAPGSLRRAYSSHWAIPLCGSDGTAQLSVGIPDGPRDVQVVDGRLVFRQIGGGTDFDEVGVPIRYPTGLPLTPEAAVQAIFTRTGVRTRTVPSAFNQFDRSVGQFPLCASWRIQLEHAVLVRGDSSGTTRSIDELFVRHAPACFSDSTVFYAGTPEQPTTLMVRFPRDTTVGSSLSDRDSAEVTLVGPIRFERVTPR